jgi:KDO2-lipid IV(A) lauroyltransferase
VKGPQRLAGDLAVTGYAAGWALSKRVPEPVARAAFRAAADVVWRRRVQGVRQLEANLARARPQAGRQELRALSRSAMRSYLRYWCEAFRLPVWSPEEVVGRIATVGEEPLRAAHARGKGVVIALPHMANWDHAGAWACLTGMPLTTVAERLRPEPLYERFVAYRESLGMEIVALDKGANTFSTLADRLRQGRLVALVADRDLTATGVEVALLGEPARLPAGPAALCRVTGATLVAATLSFAGGMQEIHFHPPIPSAPGRAGLVATTQRLADAFSAGIRAHPSDWHMLQRVFAADLAPPAVAPGSTR